MRYLSVFLDWFSFVIHDFLPEFEKHLLAVLQVDLRLPGVIVRRVSFPADFIKYFALLCKWRNRQIKNITDDQISKNIIADNMRTNLKWWFIAL